MEEIWKQWECDYEEGQQWLKRLSSLFPRCSDCQKDLAEDPGQCIIHAKRHCEQCCCST